MMKRQLLLAIALAFTATADTLCTQDAYYQYQSQETYQANYNSGMVFATGLWYGLASLMFPDNQLGNDECNYDKDNPNGWNILCLTPDCCWQNVSKWMSQSFGQECGKVTTGAAASVFSSSVVATIVVEGPTIGDQSTENIFVEAPRTVNTLVPNAASTSVDFQVYGPPQYVAGINGVAMYNTYTQDIEIQGTESLNYPYYPTETCLGVVCPESQAACACLPVSTTLNDYDYAYSNFMIASIPKSGCGVDGTFLFTQKIGCRDSAGCNVTLLGLNPEITIGLYTKMPDCPTTSTTEEITLLGQLLNAVGEIVLAVLTDTSIRLSLALSTDITPVNTLNCSTQLTMRTWDGEVVGTWENIQQAGSVFSPVIVSATQLTEILQFTIPGDLVDEQGNAMEISSTCPLQWVASTRSNGDLPLSVAYSVPFSVSKTASPPVITPSGGGGDTTSDDGDDDDDDDNNTSKTNLIIVIGAVSACCLLAGVALLGLVAKLLYDKKKRQQYQSI